MAEYSIDLRSSCRQEADGSLTVMIQISGLPHMDAANRIGLWMRKIIQENAHEIGRRAPAPSQQ